MLYLQGMKNFIKQIPIKFGGFYVIKMNMVQTALSVDKHTKISVKGQISADNIGEPIYRSVSICNSINCIKTMVCTLQCCNKLSGNNLDLQATRSESKSTRHLRMEIG